MHYSMLVKNLGLTRNFGRLKIKKLSFALTVTIVLEKRKDA